MNAQNAQKVEELLDESNACIGMIDEIRCKCKIYLEKEPDDSMVKSMSQMQNDLTKYSFRLKSIHKELCDYGVISKV